MRLAGGLVDEGAGLRNPVMLQVSPVATHGISTNRAHVVVNAELGSRESLQNDAEPSGRDVKAARLEPDAFRIRNPAAVIVRVNVRDKVSAVPSVRIEAVGKAVEVSDRHLSFPLRANYLIAGIALRQYHPRHAHRSGRHNPVVE